MVNGRTFSTLVWGRVQRAKGRTVKPRTLDPEVVLYADAKN